MNWSNKGVNAMQVKRICKVCKQEYYVDADDNVNLCHTCYLSADRQIRQGKIKDFDEYKLEKPKNYTMKFRGQ